VEDKIEALIVEVSKLQLSKEDILVLKVPVKVLHNKSFKDKIRDSLKSLSIRKFLVLPKEIDLEVISEVEDK